MGDGNTLTILAIGGVYYTRMADAATTMNGNTELIGFLQEHFTTIDKRFEKIDEQFVEVGRRFTEAEEHVRLEFKKINERIDGLYTLIDSFITLHQKLDIELTALRDKYNHLSKAHNGLANEHRELVARVARLEGTPA